MEVNRDKIQERLDQLDNKGNGEKKEKKGSGGGTSIWFRGTVGKTYLVRLLPYKHLPPDEPPIVVVYQHGLRIRSFPDKKYRYAYCGRKTMKDDCPICNTLSEVWQGLEGTNKELAKEIYKEVAPKMNFVTLCLIHEDTDVFTPQLYLWSMSKTIYKGILREIYSDPDYGCVHDVERGKKIKLSCFQEKDRTYPNYSITPKPNVSPLTKEEKKIIEASPYSDMNIIKYIQENNSINKLTNDIAEWVEAMKKRFPDAAQYFGGLESLEGFKEIDDEGTVSVGTNPDDDLPF